jgi:SAM-dependent methyltransferase
MELFHMSVARGTNGQVEDSIGTLDCCRVCAGPVAPAWTAHEMMIGTRDSFDYVECQHCGCLQIARIPADLDRYYGDFYFTKSQCIRRIRPGGLLGMRRRWTRFRLLESGFARAMSGRRYARFDWFRRTGTGIHDKILDVGCGSGRLLRRLHAEGFEQLVGIDVREGSDLPEGRGPGFERVSPEDHRGCYRLVMSHHSFEHMQDPVRVFAAFARLLEPGGFLLLRLPLADSWARRHYGANWVQLDAPRHLHLHTRRSIEILAERSGFRVARVTDDSGPFQIWGSELYRRGISLDEVGRGGRREFSLLDRLSARIRARRLSRRGSGDQACFYLQRL